MDLPEPLARLPLHLFDIRNVVKFSSRGLEPGSGVSHPRRSASSASATPSCINSSSSDTCQKPTDASSTLPITLGVLVPLTLALVAFLILHRRYKKKLRAEDIEDAEKYKSMDFGTDLRYGGKGKKGRNGKPEMRGMENQPPMRNGRGLSLDDGNPYLFPNGRNSHESLASITRSVRDADHRYQLHAFGNKADDMSVRSPTPLGRRGTDSTAAGSTMDGADAYLVPHAQAFGRSTAPMTNLLPPPPEPSHGGNLQEPEKAMLSAQYSSSPRQINQGSLAPMQAEPPRESYIDHAAFRKSNNYLSHFINSREPSMIEEDKPAPAPPLIQMDSSNSTLIGSFGSDMSPKISITDAPNTSPAPRPSPAEKALAADPRDNVQSMSGSIHDANSSSFVQSSKTSSFISDGSSFMYGDTPIKVAPASPRDSASTYTAPTRGQSLAAPLGDIREQRESVYLGDGMGDYDYDPQRLSVLMRPLPHEDPTENPEERANRIRSFYKEYFDDSKGRQGQGQMPQGPPIPEHTTTDYYEDYDSEYLNNAYAYTVYDNDQQGFVVGGAPFAEPLTRRAMTPPPRAPPRFRSRASSGAASSQYQGRPRGNSSASNYQSQGPRSERGRAPKRNIPPPQPLISLKTPHLLKDDSALYTTLDLAPPPTFRDRQAGRRPDSPLGVERPYSPVVRAYTPLNTSFEELSAMPSPHLLRRSGTFTALDFAPPTRLRNLDTGSDAGSIRSGRSGVSAAQTYAIRAGAHRLSRLPKELAGTKDDLMTSLKPTWDLRY